MTTIVGKHLDGAAVEGLETIRVSISEVGAELKFELDQGSGEFSYFIPNVQQVRSLSTLLEFAAQDMERGED